MSTNPNGATINQGMTDYAFSIFQDYEKIQADAKFIAPIVPTGGAIGNFAKFGTKNDFLVYNTKRSIGGSRVRIKFSGGTDTYSCEATGAEIPVDDQEVKNAGGNRALVEKAKTRTLLNAFTLSRLQNVLTVATTSGNYTAAGANVGKFSSGTIDPIKKLDDEIVAFHNRTGMLPNRMTLDFASWVVLRNHPLVIARQPGAANIGITTQQLQGMLAAPIEIRIISASVDASGFGDATESKAAVGAGVGLMFYAQDMATVYDPSAIKIFTPDSQAFNSVRMYRDESIASDLLFLDASESIKSVSALLMTKISIT